ncbi:hypothetical protein [Chryseobacterium rhizosphaerae]|uniref:Uncharacterized protein n=1 Tax=Chryseobacterium rhizosphaerae TaxID=395937 RepID=A0ABX9IRB5_9FLAO|nr:hypothetical protein [Chryseobacterium rhizosphaerae]REC78976.1 hypothetical protein DRF57_01490 [Chryseobacterium rhizosphaerae]GEN68065.1 hypothetical protein CRH01_26330 [Chryseobacterium rhizosphaerae]
MPTITDFQEFIDSIEDKDIEEINSLYESIQGCIEMGSFKCSLNNNRYFVQCDDNDITLMLASEEAKSSFLKVLDYQFGGGFGWVGGQYEFVRSMRKDD